MNVWYAFLNALGIRMFEMDFMKNALLAVLLLGPLFGLLSTMIVTGKMSFFSDALGHSGFTGIAIGVLCGAVQPIYFAVGLSVLFALLFSFVRSRTSQSADTIIGNCDSSIFLGGKEPGTLKELNQALGKETIDTFNTGESRGREVSHSLNYQKLGKDLATIDELAVMDGGKCILQLRGVRPFLSDKYDITRHPNYKYLSDANPRNAFDIEKYLSTRLVPKADEVYEVFDAGRV